MLDLLKDSISFYVIVTRRLKTSYFISVDPLLIDNSTSLVLHLIASIFEKLESNKITYPFKETYTHRCVLLGKFGNVIYLFIYLFVL
jgi:hypothetical protein